MSTNYEVQFDLPRAKRSAVLLGSVFVVPVLVLVLYFAIAYDLLVEEETDYSSRFTVGSRATDPPKTTKTVNWSMVSFIVLTVAMGVFMYWRQWSYATAQECTITPVDVQVTLMGTCGPYSKSIAYPLVRAVVNDKRGTAQATRRLVDLDFRSWRDSTRHDCYHWGYSTIHESRRTSIFELSSQCICTRLLRRAQLHFTA